MYAPQAQETDGRTQYRIPKDKYIAIYIKKKKINFIILS